MPPQTSKALRMSYRIARGEQGVLTFEPYKSALLPYWRFRTVKIARESSATLWEKFLDYYAGHDFVGMDMARKFIQMGMTRAKRYANYKGGRKYVGQPREVGKGYGRRGREVLERSDGHEGQEEKMEASEIFRGFWERCLEHEGYGVLREEFLAEQRAWEADGGSERNREAYNGVKREGSDVEVKSEDNGEADNGVKRRGSDVEVKSEDNEETRRRSKRRETK